MIINIFQIGFFVGGWIFFVKQLFRDYEVRHVSVQLIFSSTFAISLAMFELIIFEIIGLLESSSRYFHWRLELTLLLFMVIALIPFYIAYSSISNICFGMMIFFNYYKFQMIINKVWLIEIYPVVIKRKTYIKYKICIPHSFWLEVGGSHSPPLWDWLENYRSKRLL